MLSESNCSDLVIIRKSPKIDSFFLTCIFNSHWGHSTVSGNLVGAAQQHFNIGAAKEMTINIPSPLTQQKIAAILSSYDELIKNNTQRIKILEEMAQAIYREWFVNFRFPGHEGVRMVESELGLVPEGWEVQKLGVVCNITMGQSPKSEYYNEIGEGLPFHQGVTNFGSRFPVDKIYCTIPNRIAERGDVLFSVRAPVGRINLADKKIVVGRGLSAIRHKNGNQLFIYQQLKEIFQEEDTIGGGTIFKSVTKEDVNNIQVLTPIDSVIKSFEENVEPISLQLDNLIKKNVNIRRTRDLLLPKLISGELDVSVLDIRIPETEA
jgi:type I restriction enzyme S subunit